MPSTSPPPPPRPHFPGELLCPPGLLASPAARLAGRPRQRQLPHHQEPVEQITLHLLARRHHPHRDWQVETRSLLLLVGWRQVDRRPPHRRLKPRVRQRRAVPAKSSLARSSCKDAGVKNSGPFFVTASNVGGICRPLLTHANATSHPRCTTIRSRPQKRQPDTYPKNGGRRRGPSAWRF